MTVETIDLKFLGESAAIAAYAVPDQRGYTLVECGPYATHENLIDGLQSAGVDSELVHSLLLTHIHFDHAGAAWWWAKHKGTKVYVHPRGLRHMIDPDRLYNSAARIYGAQRMESLWGRMEKIDPVRIAPVDDLQVLDLGGRRWTAHHTPGHASHHIAWQVEDAVFTGDVGGVVIKGGPVVPPCPPPDVDVDAWMDSLDRLRALNAATFYPTHFGPVDPGGHLDALEARLGKYVSWVRERLPGVTDAEALIEDFTTMVETELRAVGADETVVKAYRAANPPYMSVTGIARWLNASPGN